MAEFSPLPTSPIQSLPLPCGTIVVLRSGKTYRLHQAITRPDSRFVYARNIESGKMTDIKISSITKAESGPWPV